MPPIRVQTGDAAFIEVNDGALLNEIYAKISSNKGVPPRVEFRAERESIALVFADTGEVLLGVRDFMDDLEPVAKAGGRFLVTARRPVGPMDGGGTPGDPPPPDVQCPC